MNGHIDTSDLDPLNTPAAAEGGYGSIPVASDLDPLNTPMGAESGYESIDTSQFDPLNAQAAAEGGHRSIAVASDRALLSHPSTDDAPLTRPVGGRAHNSSQYTPVDGPELLRPDPRSTNRTDGVDSGLQTALKWGEMLCFALVDVAIIVAGTHLIVLHRRDETSVCMLTVTSDRRHRRGGIFATDDDYSRLEEIEFSEFWLGWAFFEVVLKLFITGARVGLWWLILLSEGNPADQAIAVGFASGLYILTWIHWFWAFVGLYNVASLDESCDPDMDEPIFQLCLVTLFISVITVDIKLLRGRVCEELSRVGKTVLIVCTCICVTMLLWDLRWFLLQRRPRTLLYLCLVVICLCLLGLLARLLQRCVCERERERG